MKNIGCLLVIIFAVLAIVASIEITKAVWTSNLPMWLKFWILAR